MNLSFNPRAIALFALTVLLAVTGCYGQTAMGTTTLSAALTTSATSFKIASTTGVVNASQPLSSSEIGNPTNASFILLFVDKEAMAVQTVNTTSLVVNVIRGWNGTMQTPHVSGAKVFVGPSYAYGNFDPAGACQAATLPYLPRVVPTTGNVWSCGNGQWAAFASYAARLTLGAVIDSTGAGITIAPTNPVHHVSNTGSIATITVPPACPKVCQIILIPDAAFTTTNAGNIYIASTGVVSKALIMTYDGTKWAPSY